MRSPSPWRSTASGWEPQNLLFNTLDALLGDPLISDAMDNGEGAGAKAYLLDSTVAATGQLSVTATNAGAISSDISNTSTSNAEAWTGANGFSFGGVIASNKVSAAAEASIDWTAGYVGTRSIIADDGIAVSANNAADLSASIELDVSSETVNNALDGNNLAASDAIGISGACPTTCAAAPPLSSTGPEMLDTAGNLTVEARNSSTFDAWSAAAPTPPAATSSAAAPPPPSRRWYRPTPSRATAKPTSATAHRHQRPDRRRRQHLRAERHRPDGRNQQPHHLRRPVGQRHPGLQHAWLGTAKHPVQPR